MINTKNILYTNDQLRELEAFLRRYDKGLEPNASHDELRRAATIVNSAIHPDTGEIVPVPFRMSAFVPMNVPIAMLMLSWPTPFGLVFSQWLNQSYNTAINYANRNASTEMDNFTLFKTYSFAVGASCALALGLRQLTHSSLFAKYGLSMAQKFVPYLAVAGAGAMNCAVMRRDELEKGVDVFDIDGNSLGTSVIAGREAVWQTVVCRVVLPAPILAIPPVIMSSLKRFSFMRNPRLAMLTEVAVVAGCLGGGLPATLGLFPQKASLDVSKIEPEFRGLTTNGKPISTVYFNKGL